jgi:anion-transporting  ArsA/GET3 family ATPase
LALSHTDERLCTWFGADPSTDASKSSIANVNIVRLEPLAALKEYGRLVLKSRLAYNAIFENPKVLNFLLGVPGMQAWAMLGKAYYHAVERRGDNKRYDLVIVDAPATGHALDMLRVPQVISNVAPQGLLRREAENALELFADPLRSSALLVTLPEEMPTSETLELRSALLDELHWAIRACVLNQQINNPINAIELEALNILSGEPALAPIENLIHLGQLRAKRAREQQSQITRLKNAKLSIWPLPRLPPGVHTSQDLAKLADALEQFEI